MAEEKKAAEEKAEKETKTPSTDAKGKQEASKEEKKPEAETKVAEETKEESKEVEVPAKFKSLVEEIEKMSVLDLAELVKILEEKFGVSAAAPAMMMASGGAEAGGEGAAEEKTEFTVELTDAGDTKIAVIKAVKEITGLGLADAKALVDGAPKAVKEDVAKEEAEEMKKKIEEAGGKVELK
ncbi:MAG: 50S ribosomal protein L7/L12 [Candidatus Magasanikbacteria bacterium]|nr:50S ribosomal protein L7/L12 [Candidatus Magasanikbacteria bacterium]